MKQNEKTYRKNYYTSDDSGKILIATVLAPLLVMVVFALVGGAIASAMGLDSKTLDLNKQLWFAIPYSIIMPLVLLAVFLIYNKVTKTAFSAANLRFRSSNAEGKAVCNWKNYVIAIVMGVVSLFGLQYLINCTDYLISLTGFHLAEGVGVLPWTNGGWLILNILIFAVMPAIFEELLFRGVILSGLRKNCSDVVAILLSAAMFALYHHNLQQLVYPFLLGLILGWIVTRTGSTVFSMIVHFVNNFIVVMMFYFSDKTQTAMVAPAWWMILLAFVLLAVTVLIIYLIDRFYFKHKNQVEVEKFQKSKISLFVWVGMGVAFVLFLFETVWNFMSPA